VILLSTCLLIICFKTVFFIGNQNLDIEERLPVWYIIDEFGARIQHAQEPSTRLVPFFYINEQASYSLLFPISDIEENQEITRDFVEGCSADVVHQAALAFPWSSEFSDKYLQYISFEQIEPKAEYFAVSFYIYFILLMYVTFLFLS
jgi:tubulin--tyrosine ligase-like protein 12